MPYMIDRDAYLPGRIVDWIFDRGFMPIDRAKGRSLPVRLLAVAVTPFWFFGVMAPAMLIVGVPCMLLTTVFEMWDEMR